MNNLKKYIKPAIVIGISLIVYILAMGTLHYFAILKVKTVSTINFLAMALIMFIGGVALGKKTSKKGYLEGVKLGGVMTVVLLLLNLIMFRHFDLCVVLYYIVLIVSATIGSMIGINMHR